MGSKETGRLGEDLAARVLEEDGYTVVARNVHTLYGEVDIIAEGEGCICFVEVRARQKAGMVSPLESITPAKKRKIVMTALLYLNDHPTELQPRFDLFCACIQGGKVDCYEHIKGAFDADGY
ncbi:MAG: YraN family protein [Oscillospiraceae bacterium]|nr:YraN family protein [Oscillospiraceae bacterium]